MIAALVLLLTLHVSPGMPGDGCVVVETPPHGYAVCEVPR